MKRERMHGLILVLFFPKIDFLVNRCSACLACLLFFLTSLSFLHLFLFIIIPCGKVDRRLELSCSIIILYFVFPEWISTYNFQCGGIILCVSCRSWSDWKSLLAQRNMQTRLGYASPVTGWLFSFQHFKRDWDFRFQ